MKSGFSSFSSLIMAASAVCVAVGCSPELVGRDFKLPKQEFGPSREDGIVDLGEVKTEALPKLSSVRWKGDISTAAWYRTAEDIGWLARSSGVPKLGKLALRMYESVAKKAPAKKSVTWEHSVSNSAYASAAIGESRADTEKAVKAGIDMLTNQEALIEGLIKTRNEKTVWPTERISLVALIESIDKFIVGFVRDVEVSRVDPAVKKALVQELRVNFGPKLKRIRSQFGMAYNEAKAYDFVAKVRQVLKDEGLELGPEINAQLDLAERLPRQVEQIDNAKKALSVLVDFWLVASAETRETKFKVLAPDLYDFFKDQSTGDLECLRNSCGLLTRIKRILFILPEIEKFGVDKIRNQLSAAAEESIRSELEMEAVKFLPDLHKEVFSQIQSELARQRTTISTIAKDYGKYMRVVLGRMAIARLGVKEKDTVAGVEPSEIRVDLDFGRNDEDKLKVVRVPPRAGNGNAGLTVESGAGAIGAGISTAIEMHDYQMSPVLFSGGTNPVRVRQAQGRVYFEQINKVLMIGGFKTESSKLFDAFTMAVGKGQGSPERFNLRTMLSSEKFFAVPDRFTVSAAATSNAVVGSAAPRAFSVSVAGQADLLRGLSRMARSLRDWESAPFDESLGDTSVADFVPDLPRDSVDQKLFPKDLFFAAAVGNAGAILRNLSKLNSPVALIQPNRGMHWANEKDPAKDISQRALRATVFDINGDERSLKSQSVDVARFLSAIVEFLRATDGIENSKSEVLIAKDAGGFRAIDQLIAARADLKLLVLALANFLSSETLGPDGLVLPTFLRSAENQALGMWGEPNLLDQAVVIRALLDASETLSAGIFKNAALDLLSAATTAFFKPELAFFSESRSTTSPPSLEAIANILVAGERLSAHMSSERASQWRNISRPWLNALRDAAEELP